MITPQEVYFIQDLVLYDLNIFSLREVRKEWKQILQTKKDKQHFLNELQREADRLGHHISVAETLARAFQ